MILDIAHVCIAARDLDATERFYCGALGLRRKFDFLRAGRRVGFYLEVTPGRYLEVFAKDIIEPGDRHPLLHLCLQVDDIDAVRSRLKAAGIDTTEKKLGADRSWQAWVTDPSGVRIEFHQYTPESSQVTGRDCVLG